LGIQPPGSFVGVEDVVVIDSAESQLYLLLLCSASGWIDPWSPFVMRLPEGKSIPLFESCNECH
jgi:hypothetical protein